MSVEQVKQTVKGLRNANNLPLLFVPLGRRDPEDKNGFHETDNHLSSNQVGAIKTNDIKAFK